MILCCLFRALRFSRRTPGDMWLHQIRFLLLDKGSSLCCPFRPLTYSPRRKVSSTAGRRGGEKPIRGGIASRGWGKRDRIQATPDCSCISPPSLSTRDHFFCCPLRFPSHFPNQSASAPQLWSFERITGPLCHTYNLLSINAYFCSVDSRNYYISGNSFGLTKWTNLIRWSHPLSFD